MFLMGPMFQWVVVLPLCRRVMRPLAITPLSRLLGGRATNDPHQKEVFHLNKSYYLVSINRISSNYNQ